MFSNIKNDNISNSRSIIECALLSAISVVLFMTIVISPAIGSLFIDICVIPIAISAIKYNFKYSFIAVLTSTLLITLFSGYEFGSLYFLAFALCGFVIGLFIHNKRSAITTIIASSLVFLLSIFIFSSFPTFFSSISAIIVSPSNFNSFITEFKDTIMKTLSFQNSFNIITETQMINYKIFITERLELAQKFIPSIILILALLRTTILYIIIFHILKKLSIIKENPNKFSNWKIGKIWTLGILIILSRPYFEDNSFIINIIDNFAFCFQYLFFFYALAIITYFLIYFKLNKFICLIIYCLCFYLANITFLFGLLDCFFNFRKNYVQKKL